MDRGEYFRRMLAYERWANHECLAAMRKSGFAETKTLRLMAHTLSAAKLWLERLQTQPQTLPVWPLSTLEECASMIDSIADSWLVYIKHLSPDDFNQQVEYRNSRGEAWSNRVEDVITHVLFHSAYHRGQIALEMRTEGFDPANTDFIHAVRHGFVK